MKTKWRMPHPATMFMLLTMAVVFLSWICDIYGLKVTLPQTGEDIRVQSLLSPEGIRWWLRNAIKNFTGFAPLGLVIIAMFGLGVAQHSGFIDACIRMGVGNRQEKRKIILWVIVLEYDGPVVGAYHARGCTGTNGLSGEYGTSLQLLFYECFNGGHYGYCVLDYSKMASSYVR